MSYMKDKLINDAFDQVARDLASPTRHLDRFLERAESDRELELRERLERTRWEIDYAIANHEQAIREWEAYCAAKADRLAQERVKAGKQPF